MKVSFKKTEKKVKNEHLATRSSRKKMKSSSKAAAIKIKTQPLGQSPQETYLAETAKYGSDISQLFQMPGDLRFFRAKIGLASASGSLSSAIALSIDPKEIGRARTDLANQVRNFSAEFGSKVTLSLDPDKNEALDAFACEITDFAMAHRQR